MLGSALELLRDPYGWWPRKYREHGSVFRLSLPIDGGSFIAIAGREANERMAKEGHRLFSQQLTYPKAPEILETTLHPSITEGDLQRHLRRQVAPGFSRQALGPHLPAMRACVRELVEGWRAGESFDVTERTARLGLECISLFATGERLGLSSEDVRSYATVFTGVIAMGWPMAMMRLPSVDRARRGLDRMIAERLAHHQRVPAGSERAPDYFDSILAGTLPDGSPLPERVRVVFGQIPFKNMGVYAGRVINHVLYQLVSRPEVLARVQPEIDRVLADGEITLDELASMHAFRATILETLRVLPIAVALQRTVCEPFEIGGYAFDVGDRLFTPLSVTHFLEEHFPDPERFDIDRFMPERSEDRQPYVLNPFGLGNHACVARGIFEAITMVVVGSILHRWKLDARYRLRTIVDALPGPWPFHRMDVIEARETARVGRTASPTPRVSLPAELARALDSAPRVELAKGEALFREGDASDRVYFVIEGSLRVERRAPEGHALVLGSLGQGDVVGEVGILHGVRRTATVIAETETRLFALDADTLRTMVMETDSTAHELADLARRRHAGALLASLLRSDRAAQLTRRGSLASVHADAGETLLCRGERGTELFLLVSGSVDVVVPREHGDAITVATLRAPDCFGEMALLHDAPRAASVVVSEDGPAQLITLDRDAFDALAADPEARSALVSLAARRHASARSIDDGASAR